jgi:hypothetical protein
MNYKPQKQTAMKTTKIFSVLSLALIFAGLSIALSTTASSDGPGGFQTTSVRYDVNIHLVADNNLCNVYLVQITDEKGRIVAPAQRLEPGKAKYTFHEYGLMRGKLRIAKLVMAAYPLHFVCVNDLFTPPAAKEGPFLYGHIYTFDLYPAITAPQNTDQD